MTGAQIREWMEWSACGYEQAGKNLLGDKAPAEPTASPAEPTTSPAEPNASPDEATGSAVSAGTGRQRGRDIFSGGGYMSLRQILRRQRKVVYSRKMLCFRQGAAIVRRYLKL